MSLKVSKETLIENLDNADFANNLRSLIDEIKQNAKKSVQIDISAWDERVILFDLTINFVKITPKFSLIKQGQDNG